MTSTPHRNIHTNYIMACTSGNADSPKASHKNPPTAFHHIFVSANNVLIY